jgi:hypothetical protein
LPYSASPSESAVPTSVAPDELRPFAVKPGAPTVAVPNAAMIEIEGLILGIAQIAEISR